MRNSTNTIDSLLAECEQLRQVRDVLGDEAVELFCALEHERSEGRKRLWFAAWVASLGWLLFAATAIAWWME